MNYALTTPCDACPFLTKMKHGFTARRLHEFAEGPFHCHKTGVVEEERSGGFIPIETSSYCAGMLIFNEKRNQPNQMMRIGERLGMYDRRKLNMKAKVR